MNRRNLIHTLLFTAYVGFNAAIFTFSQQIGFSVIGQFVLIPLVVILGASLLYVLDQALVLALSPAHEAVMSTENTQQVISNEAPQLQAVSCDRRVNPGRLSRGAKERRRASFNPPMMATS